MAAEFIRVRDIRTNEILPHAVPKAHLKYFDYLKEVPSSKAARANREEAEADLTVLVEEPAGRGPKGRTTSIKEPAKPVATKEA